MQYGIRFFSHFLVGTMLVSGTVFAAPDEAVEDTAATFSGLGLLNVGSSMVAVIGAILLLAWLYKRSQSYRSGSTSIISIIAAQSLGPKEKILVVDVAGEQLVLGMTATQVSTLHVLTEPVVSEQGTPAIAGFASRLRTALRGDAQ